MRTAALVFAFLLSVSAVAQQSEVIEVRVTNIDVVVTDRAGKPVTGLTRDDFEIVESGKPRAITNFSEVSDTAATPAGAEAPAATAAAPSPRRRMLVFIDTTSTHPHARTQLIEAFERSLNALLREGDQAALAVFNGSSTQTVSGLTSDRTELLTRLREALRKSGGTFAADNQKNTILENAQSLLAASDKGNPPPPPTTGAPSPGEEGSGTRPGLGAAKDMLTLEQAYSMATSPVHSYAEQLYRTHKALLASVRQTIDIVAGAGGKKVLLFIGGDLSDNPGAEMYQQVDAVFAPYRTTISRAGFRDPNRSLSADLRSLAQHATTVGVTMYMVDAGQRGAGNDAGQRMTELSGPTGFEIDTASAMSNIAALTGGVYGPGGKAFQNVLNTIANDFASYYSLGYRSEARSAGAIEVRVKRPGVRVRTRRFHEGGAPALAAATPAAQPAAAASAAATTPAAPVVADDSLEGRLRSNLFDDANSDFPISVTASAPVAQPNGRYQTELSIKFPTSVKLVEEGTSLKGRVAILMITANEEGRTSRPSTQVQELTFPRASRAQLEAQKTITYNVPLLVGAGKVTVSVAVADQLAGTSGFARTVVTTP